MKGENIWHRGQELLTLSYITDCDTGMYAMGEIDFGIVSGVLDDYLKRYGYKGKNEITSMLGYLIYEVEKRFRETQPNGQVAQTTA